ncbi:MAG: ribosome biogenesis GTPase Der [Ignavibacteriae bacterium]|nr:ribosome biogenesis GTPase Der [Ignavibacteriota bacterium]MCB9243843.1 ribosome biogenesis GTPase Der [Ignavibacteriales bacterium]
MKNVIAIVGRPNVGKSTLFNKIIGKRIAIVHPTSGVTRDRNSGEAEWLGKKFFLIDTGGFVPDTDEKFEKAIREQIGIALDEADKILFVVDAANGLHPIDREIANMLRKYDGDKPIILAANKADNDKRDLNAPEFFSLGLGEPIPIAANTGRNVAELLDILTEDIPSTEPEEEDDRMKFAVVGKPNAGKSSLVNALLKEDRNIVTDIPGTTRDSIDSILKYHGEDVVLIDTAGLRKKSKIKRNESLEFYSTMRTFKSIQRCDVAILVIDATEIMEALSDASDIKLAVFKLDKQDVNIIEEVLYYKKGLLLVINKWDLVEKDEKTAEIIRDKINDHLKTYNFLKIIFISALTKQRIHKVLEEAVIIYNERKREIKTSELNEELQKEIKNTPHPSARGKELKINYITQVKSAPPVFAFFCNEPKMVKESYKRFLEKKLRSKFGFEGVPIGMIFKKKN